MSNFTPFFPLRRSAYAVAGLGVLIFFLAGCAQKEGADLQSDTLAVDSVAVDSTTVSAGTINDVLRKDARFSTFVTAVDSADLDQTLSGPGPFTLFVPANEAFDRAGTNLQELLQEENVHELRDLLLGHMANGERMASALEGERIRTLAGGDLDISRSGDSLRVGDAQIVDEDIRAANGVIHVVERVLVPSMEDEGL